MVIAGGRQKVEGGVAAAATPCQDAPPRTPETFKSDLLSLRSSDKEKEKKGEVKGWGDYKKEPAAAQSTNRMMRVSSVHSSGFLFVENKLKSLNGVEAKEVSAPEDRNATLIAAQTFTFRTLATVTKNFRPECLRGEGRFRLLYKCRLDNGQVVTVKRLDRNGLQGNQEFLVEVLMLSLLHHANLINLTGYCVDGDHRHRVYEYMPMRSLEDHLHG